MWECPKAMAIVMTPERIVAKERKVERNSGK
jgi:hypothetical protein